MSGNTPAEAKQGCCGQCHCHDEEANRREFIYLAAGGMGIVGAAAAAWPLVDSMNPAADTLSASTIEVDLSNIPVGQSATKMWRGKPIFIRHRTPEEIAQAKEIDAKVDTLRDKELDSVRVKKEEWLIVVGVCTHLGCIPGGQKATEKRGEYHGWFCACHGSQYDTSGRIMAGPAPKNLQVPEYTFLTDTLVRIG